MTTIIILFSVLFLKKNMKQIYRKGHIPLTLGERLFSTWLTIVSPWSNDGSRNHFSMSLIEKHCSCGIWACMQYFPWTSELEATWTQKGCILYTKMQWKAIKQLEQHNISERWCLLWILKECPLFVHLVVIWISSQSGISIGGLILTRKNISTWLHLILGPSLRKTSFVSSPLRFLKSWRVK